MELRPLEGFGVEVDGVALAHLSDAELEESRRAVDDVGLVVARGQSLTRESHVQLALRFGPIDEYDTRVPNASAQPYVPRPPGTRVVTEATEAALAAPDPDTGDVPRWRLDGSFKSDTVCYSTEAAMEVSGGAWTTWFANLQRAFGRLDEIGRARAEELSVWHSAVYAKALAGQVDVAVPDDPHQLPGASHPLVRVHAATGRRGFYIGENAVAVVGAEPGAGREILDRYVRMISHPENLALHRWQTGDVVIWDSRFVAHRRQPPVGMGSATIRHVSVLSGQAS